MCGKFQLILMSSQVNALMTYNFSRHTLPPGFLLKWWFHLLHSFCQPASEKHRYLEIYWFLIQTDGICGLRIDFGPEWYNILPVDFRISSVTIFFHLHFSMMFFIFFKCDWPNKKYNSFLGACKRKIGNRLKIRRLTAISKKCLKTFGTYFSTGCAP